MKNTLLLSLATTLVLSTVPVASPVQATAAIQRCRSSDGTLVYTDKACAAFGAKAIPMSGELLTRIAREEARATDSTMDAGTLIGNVSSASRILPSRRSPASGCARTPTQLAMDLGGALALGDVNRVAESYHWVGMSSRQADRTLDRLQRLTGKPVIDTHYFDAQINLGGMPDAGATVVASSVAGIGGDAGVLQVVLGDNATRSVTDFNVHKYAGCYFVKF